MAAEEKVTIIVCGRDQVSKVFGTVGTAAEKTGKKVEIGLGKKLESVGKHASKAGKILSLGVTAPLGLFAGVAVNAAVKSERLTKTLVGLAGGAKNAEKYVEAIGKASLGTVSRVDALAAANRALAFEVVDSTEKMAQLTEIAITLGRAQGLTATQAVNDFTTALSRNSPMILDNLGITLKLSEAYAIYGEKLGKTADQLTEVEKKEAFREAALIKGMEAVERMGGLQDDAAASAERMKAQMSDMAVTVGEMLIPIMSKMIDVTSPLLKMFTDAPPQIQQVAVALGVVAAAAGPVLSIFGKLTAVAQPAAAGLAKVAMGLGPMLMTPAGAAVVGVAAVTTGLVLLNDAANKSRDELNKLADMMDRKFIAAVDEAAKGTDHWRETYFELKTDLTKLAGELKNTNKLVLIYQSLTGKQGDAWKAAQQHLLLMSETQEQYNDLAEWWNKIAPDAKFHLSDMTDLEWENAQAKLEVIRTERERLDVLGQYYDALDRAAQMQREENRAVLESGETARVSAEHQRFLTDRVKEQQSTWRDMVGQYITVGEQDDAIAEKADRNAIRQEESAKRRAAAIDLMRQAWADASVEQANLITQMKDATLEEFKRKVLAMVDPTQMSREQFQELATQLGFADDESIQMTAALLALKPAIEDNVLPTENYGAAIEALYKESKKAHPEIGKVLDEFAAAPGLIGPSKDKQELYNETLKRLGEEAAPKAGQSVHDFMEYIRKEAPDLLPMLGHLDKLEARYLDMPENIKPAMERQDKMNESLGVLGKTAAPDAGDALGDFQDHVWEVHDALDPTIDRLQDHEDRLEYLGNDAGPAAKKAMDEFGGMMEDMPRRVLGAEEHLGHINSIIDDMEGTHYVDIVIHTTGTMPPAIPGGNGENGDYQLGGLVAGPIGRPRLAVVHGGEYIVNPYHRGAMGGPGGPPAPNISHSHGGNTYNYNFFNELAWKMHQHQEQRERFEAMEALM